MKAFHHMVLKTKLTDPWNPKLRRYPNRRRKLRRLLFLMRMGVFRLWPIKTTGLVLSRQLG